MAEMTKIGNIEIKGDVILSPMAGFSDSPYRQICREQGSAMSYTEFVSTDAITRGSKKSIEMFRFKDVERPITFQIFGNKIGVVTDAAKIAAELGPDILDLNMGCSVTKVAFKGSGAGLLRKPEFAGQMMESLVKNLKIPVTAKIRIGWDHQSLNYKEIVHILQESGVSAIAVHGRTKSMNYKGLADWNIIGEIKSFAKVPIFGNGDVQSLAEAKKRIAETGVDAVLIGRATIGNPWVFSGRDKKDIGFDEIRKMMIHHLELMLEFYGEEFGLKLFRKHVAKYMKGYHGVAELRNRLVRTEITSDFLNMLNDFDPAFFVQNEMAEEDEEMTCESGCEVV